VSRADGSEHVHELSICGSIADTVERHAGGRAVETVHLRIGQLRQIVPDTLAYCWSLVCEGTALAGSRLDVYHVPARISCLACGSVLELGEFPIFVCADCGSTDVTVDAGEEFLITSLDLTEA
jgi:hydrogenase nickel incorporation protein HypA/HybF